MISFDINGFSHKLVLIELLQANDKIARLYFYMSRSFDLNQFSPGIIELANCTVTYADKFNRKLKERLRNLIIDERMCSYENYGRRPIEALASCPLPKVRIKMDCSLMVTLGHNSCLYNSFLVPSTLRAKPKELEKKGSDELV